MGVNELLGARFQLSMIHQAWPLAAKGSTVVATLLLLGVFLAVGCGPDKGWKELSQEEIRALFAGSNVEGYQELNDYRFRSYYDPAGSFRSVQGDENRVRLGRWWTIESGEMCIRWDGESRDLCRKIVSDQEAQYKKVRGRDVVVSFTRFFK